MSKYVLPGMVLCLVLFAMPALAESSDETATEPTETAQLERSEAPVPEAGIQAVCTAECEYGPDQTCTGASCSAVNQACPGERGYCWGSDTGTRYCQSCTCFVKTRCPDESWVLCQGQGTSCTSVRGCYVRCDGVEYLCDPYPESCP